LKLHRAGDSSLQLLNFNEEFLVSTSHQLVLITSLPFVHTARRYYRLNGLVRLSDRALLYCFLRGTEVGGWEVRQTWSFRGSKSRNKVSVGEPAEGSLLSEKKLELFPLWRGKLANNTIDTQKERTIKQVDA
jgi:hypothetical protein